MELSIQRVSLNAAAPAVPGAALGDVARERRIDVYGGHTYNRILRIDPHVFNEQGDIDRFLAALDEYLES